MTVAVTRSSSWDLSPSPGPSRRERPGGHADRLSPTVAGPGVWHAWTDSNSVTLLEAAVSLVNIFRPGRQNSDFSYYWILSDIPNNIELLKMVNITQDG